MAFSGEKRFFLKSSAVLPSGFWVAPEIPALLTRTQRHFSLEETSETRRSISCLSLTSPTKGMISPAMFWPWCFTTASSFSFVRPTM